MKPIQIIIRDYDSKTDDPYIYSTWTKYAWYSPTHPIHSEKSKWFKDKIEEIKNTLKNGIVRIACFRADPYVITGYIVSLNDKIIWTCVKKDYQQQGIEKLLNQSMKEKMHVIP